ncbi:uncharacterized protein LOC116614719 [Nematostella vectensis]|uniref:uncharacterized protein LOC116614719 n=1 Tax=Nematostella vectensis TaxID=45351 RepID=UPI00138FF3B5|nr:uncharacterized protein LOC116614719 [Nematostella vectensis]
MLLKRALLLFAVIIPYCLSSKTDKCQEKEIKDMDKCNSVVKKGLRDNGKKGFCDSMKKLLHCVNKIDMACSTDRIKNYRFVVLAYVWMNELTGKCQLAENARKELKELRGNVLAHGTKDITDNKEFIKQANMDPNDNPALEPFSASKETKEVHTKCMSKFEEEQSENNDICGGLQNLIKCYKDATKSSSAWVSPLTDAFYNLINTMSNSLIDFFKQNKLSKDTTLCQPSAYI